MVFIRSMRNASTSDKRNREEVEGRGSGGTAGGSPETGSNHDDASNGGRVSDQESEEKGTGERDGRSSESCPSISDSSSRPPESISKGVSNAHPYQGGEDTVEISLYVAWDKNWNQVCEFLQYFKDKAQQFGGNSNCFQKGNWIFEVMPTGSGSGMVASFIVKTSGMQFKFTRSQSPGGNSPNLMVRIGSLTLMTLGLDLCWESVQSVVKLFGGTLLQNKVSRVDSCIDMPGIPMEEFVQPFLNKEFVCRSKLTNFYRDGEVVNSLSIGKEPKCRIYDKIKETNSRTDFDKFSMLLEHRWNREIPVTATRVEWQIRRSTIKELGIDSIEDWIEKRTGVFNYLFSWLRLVDTEGKEFDRRNPDRYKTLRIWEITHESFVAWSQSPTCAVDRKKPTFNVASPQLLRDMIGGCALSLIAKRATKWEGIGPFLLEVIMELKRWVREKTPSEIYQQFKNRRNKVAVKRPQLDELIIPEQIDESYWNAWLLEFEEAINGRRKSQPSEDGDLDMNNWDDPRVIAQILGMDDDEEGEVA